MESVASTIDLEQLFYEVSREWFTEQGVKYDSDRCTGIYSETLTIWLMMLQRLSGMPLQGAVISSLNDDQGGIFAKLNSRSLKLKRGDVSVNSGGFSQAKSRIEKEKIVELVQHCEKKLRKKLKDEQNIYLIDGTCLTTSYTKKNEEKFARHSAGEKGSLHFPRLRLVIAHSLANGTALKPLYGEITQSEQSLTWDYLSMLPDSSTVMGDRNFGVFSVAYRATTLGHNVLFRLNDVVFNRVVGKQSSPDCDIEKTWTPSRYDLKTTPEIPADSQIAGRFIKITIVKDGFRPESFFFFTTLKSTPEKIAELYLQRQRVETNISQLKEVLKLEFINAKTPEMIDKEIHIAFLIFNLLTAIMATTAQRLNIPFQRISFTATVRLVIAFGPRMAHARDNAHRLDLLDKFQKAVFQSKIPLRKNFRSFPRVVKRNKSKFPLQAVVPNA
jgi:hypothetical protein